MEFRKIGMTMVKNFKENTKMESQWRHGLGGFDGAPMQEGKYNLEGKFEGLYFINPQVPTFTTP